MSLCTNQLGTDTTYGIQPQLMPTTPKTTTWDHGQEAWDPPSVREENYKETYRDGRDSVVQAITAQATYTSALRKISQTAAEKVGWRLGGNLLFKY